MVFATIKNAATTDCSLLLGSVNTVLNEPFRLRSFNDEKDTYLWRESLRTRQPLSIYGPTFPTKSVIESDIWYTKWKKCIQTGYHFVQDKSITWKFKTIVIICRSRSSSSLLYLETILSVQLFHRRNLIYNQIILSNVKKRNALWKLTSTERDSISFDLLLSYCSKRTSGQLCEVPLFQIERRRSGCGIVPSSSKKKNWEMREFFELPFNSFRWATGVYSHSPNSCHLCNQVVHSKYIPMEAHMESN